MDLSQEQIDRLLNAWRDPPEPINDPDRSPIRIKYTLTIGRLKATAVLVFYAVSCTMQEWVEPDWKNRLCRRVAYLVWKNVMTGNRKRAERIVQYAYWLQYARERRQFKKSLMFNAQKRRSGNVVID